MSDSHVPVEINLHQRSHVLELAFEDGSDSICPANTCAASRLPPRWRGHAPGQEVLQKGKEEVNIMQIEPVGHYAVCLHFDDGHNTGIYSWTRSMTWARTMTSIGPTISSAWRPPGTSAKKLRSDLSR